MNLRPILITALGLLLLSACAPPKDATSHALEMAPEKKNAASLGPHTVENLRNILALYAPKAGLSREEAIIFFKRFQPELLPLVKMALPANEARYRAKEMVALLSENFPPLAWAALGELDSAAGLRASLAKSYPSAPDAVLEEILKHLSRGDRTLPKKLFQAGMLIGVLEKSSEFSQRFLLAKVGFLASGKAEDAAWAAALLGSQLVDLSGAPTLAENSKAYELHHALFSALILPSEFGIRLDAVEAFDWKLDQAISLLDGESPAKLLPLSVRRAQDGTSLFKSRYPAARLLLWETLSASEALLSRCEIPAGELLAEDDFAVALYRIRESTKGREGSLCEQAKLAFNADYAARGLWKMKAFLSR